MDSTQGFHAVMSVFLFPMWLLSGAFFPMTVEGWMKPIVWANPLTYGVAGLRHALQNMSSETAATLPSPALSWLVSIAFAAAMFAAAWWIAKTRSTGDLL
jgi:ABC-2 type transport system permease protein